MRSAKPITKPRVECVNCATLPQGERPSVRRPIDPRSGPRAPRCNTHHEATLKASRLRAAEKRRERIYGLTPEDYEGIKKLQGGFCPCGARIKHVDHNHMLARRHTHREDEGCPQCLRGLLCYRCNSEILARGYTSRMLRALADYLDDPPARRYFKEAS